MHKFHSGHHFSAPPKLLAWPAGAATPHKLSGEAHGAGVPNNHVAASLYHHMPAAVPQAFINDLTGVFSFSLLGR